MMSMACVVALGLAVSGAGPLPSAFTQDTLTARLTSASAEGRQRTTLGEALGNLQRFVADQGQTPGANHPGASVQFDTQGVEFGPWVRRFIAQMKRNWFIPAAAMTQKGITVVTFIVSKDGAIRDVKVTKPSGIAEFDRAAYNAAIKANPLEPLPPAYPRDEMAMTLSFYYNERPPAK